MTIVSLLLAMLISAAPADAERDPVRDAVAKWIQQLESPALADRRQAERELLDLGPKILPLLPPQDLLPGPASREAAKRLRIALQRRLAVDSARPSRVTLAGEFALPKVLAEITRQTNNRLRLADHLPENSLSRRTWNFADVTFWDAIDALCDKTNLAPTMAPDSDAVLLIEAPPNANPPRVQRIGVLRLALADVSRQPIKGNSEQELIRIQGDLLFEPRLRPLFVHFQAGDFSAKADGEKILPAWNPKARYELPMAGASRRTHVTWDFVARTADAVEELSLHGKLLVQLAAAAEPIAFDLPAKQELLRRRGGVSVRLFPTEFAGSKDDTRDATVKISVSYETGGPAFESHRTWVYHNAVWIEAGEKRLPFADFETLMQVDGGVQLEYRFKNLPAAGPLKFVYEAPTLMLDVPFEVEIRHVTVEH